MKKEKKMNKLFKLLIIILIPLAVSIICYADEYWHGEPGLELPIWRNGSVGIGYGVEPDDNALLHLKTKAEHIRLIVDKEENAFISSFNDELAKRWTLNMLNISDSDKFQIFYGDDPEIPQFTMTTNGDIGIGTSNPSAALHIKGSSFPLKLLLDNDGDRSSYIELKTGAISADLGIIFNNIEESNVGTITWKGDGKFVIEGGNVGIGTAEPSEKLEVDGTVKAASFEGVSSLDSPNGIHQDALVVNDNGYIGIGTETPTEKLEVDGKIKASSYLAIDEDNASFLLGDDSHICYSGFYKDNMEVWAVPPSTDIFGYYPLSFRIKAYDYAHGNFADKIPMTLKYNGLAINTTSIPEGYSLAVKGKIITTEITVKAEDDPIWPDYVFKDNYQLKKLNELENFIEKNKHLPDIPTREEVAKNGFNLGEMQSKLLQKIEELTLYIIDLQKQNDALTEKVEKLSKKSE